MAIRFNQIFLAELALHDGKLLEIVGDYYKVKIATFAWNVQFHPNALIALQVLLTDWVIAHLFITSSATAFSSLSLYAIRV